MYARTHTTISSSWIIKCSLFKYFEHTSVQLEHTSVYHMECTLTRSTAKPFIFHLCIMFDDNLDISFTLASCDKQAIARFIFMSHQYFRNQQSQQQLRLHNKCFDSHFKIYCWKKLTKFVFVFFLIFQTKIYVKRHDHVRCFNTKISIYLRLCWITEFHYLVQK